MIVQTVKEKLRTSYNNTTAILVVAIVYFFSFFLLPHDVFWSPDEGAKYLQMKAFSWQQGPQFKVVYNGIGNDPDFAFYPEEYPFGHIYPQPSEVCNVAFNWPIWFTMISYIPFSLVGVSGLYIIPLLSGLGVAFISGRIARRLEPKIAPLAILIIGLASPLLFYSLLFWEHSFVVLLGLVAFYLASQLPNSRRPYLSVLIIGALLVFASAMRIEMAVYAASMALGSFIAIIIYYKGDLASRIATIMKRQGWRWLAVATFLALLIGIFFFVAPAQENSVSSFCRDHKPTSYIRDIPQVVGTQTGNTITHIIRQVLYSGLEIEINSAVDWIGIIGIVLCALGGLKRGKNGQRLLLVGGILLLFSATYILLFPDRYRFIHSIFLPAPYLAFASLFFLRSRRYHRYEYMLLAFVSLVYILFGILAIISRLNPYSVIAPEWGARYILAIYPLLTICVLVGIHDEYSSTHIKQDQSFLNLRKLSLLVVSMLFVFGLFFSVRGLLEIRTTKSDLKAYEIVFADRNQPVVSDLFWLPAALATHFADHEIYILNADSDIGDWTERIIDPPNTFLFASFEEPDLKLVNARDGLGYRFTVQRQTSANGLLISEINITDKED